MPKKNKESQTFMIFTNVENHFYHHLLPIAKEAQWRGYKVQVLTNFEKLESKIKSLGFDTFNIKFSRKSLNPVKAIKDVYQLYQLLRVAKPDILMAFTIKPIFFSSIATIFLRKIRLFNNFVGLGLLFTDNNPKYRILRLGVSIILKLASLGRKITYITQNKDDRLELINSNISSENNTYAQCSVGVDLTHFKSAPLPKSKTICFALISRMLIDKGVLEFIEAARIVQSKGYKARFLLVGAPDEDNPKSLSAEFLNNLNKEGIIEYLGQTDDIRKIWDIAHVAVLPSYREGQSRVLLEAGAIGRAIITTDAPGGRDLINHNETGLLVKPKNVDELVASLLKIINSPANLKKFSQAIKSEITLNFEEKTIAKATLDLLKR